MKRSTVSQMPPIVFPIMALVVLVMLAAAGGFGFGWIVANDRGNQRGEHLAVWYEYHKFVADRYREYYWGSCGQTCGDQIPDDGFGPGDFIAEGRQAWRAISPLDLDDVMHLDDYAAR